MMTAFWKKQNYCQVSIRERNDVKVTVSAQHSLSDYLDPMRCFTLLSPSFHSSLPFSKVITFFSKSLHHNRRRACGLPRSNIF